MKHEKTIVLDLDHTLVFTIESSYTIGDEDFTIFLGMDELAVFKRPYVDELLEYCQSKYNITVCTAGTKIYALEIVKRLFSNINEITLITREDLKQDYVDGRNGLCLEYIKEFNDSIIIDDKAKCIKGSNNTIIEVKAFMGDKRNDTVLRDILNKI